MEFDSTLSYADKEGFRCGVCYDFPVFDFLERRQLKLREFPLKTGQFKFYQRGDFTYKFGLDCNTRVKTRSYS